MKKLINNMCMLTAGLFLQVAVTSAQKTYTAKADKVIFLNGVVKEGRVLAFAGEKIRFAYTGKTLNYEFSKNEIERIEYASGRTRVFTTGEVLNIPPVKLISKNWVAVIPMQYTGYGNEGRREDIGFYLQEIATNYLNKSAADFKIMDVADVNAILLKKGVLDSDIRRYTAKELAAILHVEYIILGTVLQDNGTVVANTGMNKAKKDDRWNDGEYRRKESYQQQVITKQLVETRVTLLIYNEAGENVYTKSRKSILSERDAYKNSIHYLLKRTMLYKK